MLQFLFFSAYCKYLTKKRAMRHRFNACRDKNKTTFLYARCLVSVTDGFRYGLQHSYRRAKQVYYNV